MANHPPLPPTLPAPASVALLDQEDIDEMSGHMANLANIENELANSSLALEREAKRIAELRRSTAGIMRRISSLIAERSEATK